MAKKHSTRNTSASSTTNAGSKVSMKSMAHDQALTGIKRKLESIQALADASAGFCEARDDDRYDSASASAFKAIAEMAIDTLHIGDHSVAGLFNKMESAQKGHELATGASVDD